MSIKLEEMMNEFRYPSQINTDKAISTSSNVTVGGTLSVTGAVSIVGQTTLSGGITVTGITDSGTAIINGNATVGGTLTVTGAVSSVGAATFGATGTSPSVTLGSGGPQIISGTLAPPANPTAVSAPLGSLFINLGATGVTNRIYINTNGATGWTYLSTAGA